ncbi:MAG: HD domain-containing protein [Defluviitaleaceae bacterium]|nr:HD domain-containing protein [Defluviitaleaceae bacterium]MCL2238780.1 HD domain-containing protein [Defluviitaleaceae bacterium]
MYESVKNIFVYYTNSILFNKEQREILNKLKYAHTLRVVDLSERLATAVFAGSTEDIAMAKTIAILHDIGRWEQMRLTGTFDDGAQDHGETGADIIAQNNILSGIDPSKQEIILTAVRQHNKKYAGDFSHDGRTQSFVNIIRDADKIDGLYTHTFPAGYPRDLHKRVHPLSEEHHLSDALYDCIMNHRLADNAHRKTRVDFQFFVMAWCFDLQLAKSKEIIREKGYIHTIFKAIKDPDERMTRAYEEICSHV